MLSLTVWCIEAEEDSLSYFLDKKNPIIGISYPKKSRSYRRFRFDSRKDDLVWLIPRGDRPGRAGIIISGYKQSSYHPYYRKKIKWLSENLFLSKEPFVPNSLVRYSKRPTGGGFVQIRIKSAIDAVRILCGMEPLDPLYNKEDLIENFSQYLEQKYRSEDTVEREFVKPWLEELGYRVEMAETKTNPIWDMKAIKRGVGTFLIQVKHTSKIEKKKALDLDEVAEKEGIDAWWISLGVVSENTISLIEEASSVLEIWGAGEIYDEFIKSYQSYSRKFKKDLPLEWVLIPKNYGHQFTNL